MLQSAGIYELVQIPSVPLKCSSVTCLKSWKGTTFPILGLFYSFSPTGKSLKDLVPSLPLPLPHLFLENLVIPVHLCNLIPTRPHSMTVQSWIATGRYLWLHSHPKVLLQVSGPMVQEVLNQILTKVHCFQLFLSFINATESNTSLHVACIHTLFWCRWAGFILLKVNMALWSSLVCLFKVCLLWFGSVMGKYKCHIWKFAIKVPRNRISCSSNLVQTNPRNSHGLWRRHIIYVAKFEWKTTYMASQTTSCEVMYCFHSNFAVYVICQCHKPCEFLGFVWTDCRGN